MATLKKVILNNFYNYYGKCTFNFSKGLNLIAADNTTGKSKFYNAFLWFFKDMVYSDQYRAEYPVNGKWAYLIVSQKALLENKNEGDTVHCSVCIEFDLDDRKDTKIRIKKIIEAKRVKKFDLGSTNDSENNWQYTCLPAEALKMQAGIKEQVQTTSDIVGYKDSLIAESLRPYFLIRGESLEDAVPLNDSAGLKRVLDNITNMKMLENVVKKAKYVKSRATDAYYKELNNVEKYKSEVKSLTEGIDNLENEILLLEERLEKFENERTRAEVEAEKYSTQMQNSEEGIALIQSRKTKIKELKRKQSKLNQKGKEFNNYFFSEGSFWVVIGTMKVPGRFRKRLVDYKTKLALAKNEKLNNKGHDDYDKLPAGLPGLTVFDQMLQEGKCFTCGRKIEEDSDASRHIKGFMKRRQEDMINEEKKEEHAFKNSFTSFFDSVEDRARDIPSYTRTAEQQIYNYIGAKNKLWEEVQQLKGDLEQLENSMSDRGVKADSEGNLKETIENYRRAESEKNRKRSEIDSLKKDIQAKKVSLNRKKERLDNLAGDKKESEASARKDAAENAHSILVEAKRKLINKLIGYLEEKSNTLFKKLTADGTKISLNLKFDLSENNTVRLRVLSDEGIDMYGMSTSIQSIKLFSVAMGIIEASKGLMKTAYPFIADAPLSTFGKGYVKSFLETIPEVFPQIIILEKSAVVSSRDLRNPEPELSEVGLQILKKIQDGDYPGTVHALGWTVEEGVEERNNTTSITTVKKIY